MTRASPPGLCWVVRQRPLLAASCIAAAGSGVGGRDQKGAGVDGAGVDSWGVDGKGVDGAGGSLLAEPGRCRVEACDLWGLLRCGLHGVSSLNTLRFGGVFSS